MNDLRNVKVGDEIVIVRGYGNSRSVRKIDKVTAKYFDAGYQRFRKDTGFPPGEFQYNQDSARLLEEGEKEEIVLKHRISKLATKLKETDFSGLPIEALEAITKLLP